MKWLLAAAALVVSAEVLLQVGYAVTWWTTRQRVESAKASSPDPTVLCLGDSFTYGMGATAPENSYPRQLESLLAKQGMQCNVVNRGWPARNSRQVLGDLERQLVQHGPSVVCIMVGVNDRWSRPRSMDGTTESGQSLVPGKQEDSPYEWRFRLPRLVSILFARIDLSNNYFQGDQAVENRSEDILGGWWVDDSDVLITFRQGGTGSLGGLDMTWSMKSNRLAITTKQGQAMSGTCRRSGSRVVVRVDEGRSITLVRDAGEGSPRSLLARAHDAMMSSDWMSARDLLARVIALCDPAVADVPRHHADYIRCLAALGVRDQVDAATQALREIVNARADACAIESLAEALRFAGREKESEDVARAAIARGMESSRLWLLCALFAEAHGDMVGARAAAAKALECEASGGSGDVAYCHRVNARLNASIETLDIYLKSILAAHMSDRNMAATRQAFNAWRDSAIGVEERIEAITRDANLPRETAEEVVSLWRQSRGDSDAEWHAVLKLHMHQIVTACRKAGAVPLLVMYPFHFGARQVVEEVAVQLACDVVRVDDVFAARREDAGFRDLFVGDGHCSDKGYELIAHCVLEHVEPILRPLSKSGGRKR